MRTIRLSFAQARFNLQGYLRSPRTLIFAVVMPVFFLVIFNVIFANAGSINIGPHQKVSPASFYTAGLMTYSVILGTFTSILVGIVSAREAGWLKRYRGTPMPPSVFLAGQILYLGAIALVLVVVMATVGAVFFGATFRLAVVPALLCYSVVGVFTFTALGLALTAVVTTSEMASSVGPITVVILSFFSGIFLPPQILPAWLVSASKALPLQPLAAAMQSAYVAPHGFGFRPGTLVTLGIWSTVSFAIAARTFKWMPQKR